jgi:hypothetical protein
MDALLTTIVLWLAANFDLAATQDRPAVVYAPAATIKAMRYRPLIGAPASAADTSDVAGGRIVVSVYDDATRTIYLTEGWRGDTPAALSVLVHEMVHHLQNVAQIRYECQQQRERIAYKAQAEWLGLFGTDLMREFELDPFTLMVSTNCVH